ncbi:hypothetical protein [Bradyrhizobium ivorense]|uniref:hypothetical protein n=1 Tax=Bradyrhizobium ivorense TaxID=2511166 RepID=UPI0010AFAF03|nr:hypothetical protein [Bradyrhizobium ivorense]VIO77360.1 hypothetical protein CI41S_56150 [Bradyrhizobium ivorense]
MQYEQNGPSKLALISLAFTCFLSFVPASAEEAKQPVGKWRPKDGIYGSPRSPSEEQCPEADNLTIELGDKSVSGYEWSCKINKVADTAPDAIKLELTCNDYNLAQNLYPRDPKAEEKSFKETMLLKRIDDKVISVRKTLNGKFEGPAWRADLCPAEIQRVYVENKAASAPEAAEKQIMLASENNRGHPADIAGVDLDTQATPDLDRSGLSDPRRRSGR